MSKRDEIFEAIRSHLIERGIEAETIKLEADIVNDLGLDSLDTVELSLGLEEAFGIELPDEEFEGVRTVSDTVDLIEKKVAVDA